MGSGAPNDDIFTHESEMGSPIKSIKIIESITRQSPNEADDMFSLALHFSSEVGRRVLNFPNTDTVNVDISSRHKLYNGRDLDDEEKKMFEEYLDRYFGLKIVGSSQPSRRGVSFKVGAK